LEKDSAAKLEAKNKTIQRLEKKLEALSRECQELRKKSLTMNPDEVADSAQQELEQIKKS
jgi:hypothetical protein